MGGLDRSWDKRIGERVRLRELRILQVVVQSGSMARAAQALSMTQPAVSQAISLLEAAVNIPVLERSPAGVAPTAIGSVLLRRTLEAMDALTECLREIEALSIPATGKSSSAPANPTSPAEPSRPRSAYCSGAFRGSG